jgi:hypothetical protein
MAYVTDPEGTGGSVSESIAQGSEYCEGFAQSICGLRSKRLGFVLAYQRGAETSLSSLPLLILDLRVELVPARSRPRTDTPEARPHERLFLWLQETAGEVNPHAGPRPPARSRGRNCRGSTRFWVFFRPAQETQSYGVGAGAGAHKCHFP